jgi:hypothetical protein
MSKSGSKRKMAAVLMSDRRQPWRADKGNLNRLAGYFSAAANTEKKPMDLRARSIGRRR